MLIRDLITEYIPPLKTSDTGNQALKWMNEFHITHLPIVNNKKLLGLISEEDILNLSKPEESLGNHSLSLSRAHISSHQHIYDMIKNIVDLKLSLIPVVDEKENYLGIITLESIISALARISSIQEPGGIIVLEVALHDYSLSEIARIVESNDAIVLSTYITSLKNAPKMEITLKINKTDLKNIVATFERFNYIVKNTYQVTTITDTLQDHYDSLMKYLNT